MELPKRVTIDIYKGINRDLKAKQNDTARYLLFTIVDNGVPFSLQGKEVKVFAVKPDEKLVYNTCQITNSTNGETKLNLTSQMLAVPGTLKAELVISERNEILSTIPFEIEVIKSLRDDRAIESTNEFTILFSKIEEGKSLEVSLSELIEEGLPLYNKLNPVVEAGKELNTSLPPKTSEADRILKQLLQAIQNGNLNRYMLKEYLDTRNDNQNPLWYMQTYPKQSITEFKFARIIGIPNVSSSIYGTLETKVPWGESSGGYPVQTFKSNSTATYQRHGISNTEWSSWSKVYTSGNKPTLNDICGKDFFTGRNENYSGIPVINNDGVMEVGKYIDFHLPNSNNDYDGRFEINNSKKLKYNNGEIYTSNNKPTPEEIGASKVPSKEKLWSGAYVFTAGHKARLSKNIKDTPNGLILRWSAYTGGVIRDYHYIETEISKDELMFGKSRVLLLADTGGNLVTKTVYVTDDGMSLIGHDNNGAGNNHGMVLREVKEF